MIKISKNFFILCLLIFVSNCSSVRDGLTLKKKSNSQQFLIEKKKPLIMPPDFDELPVPSNSNNNEELLSQTNEDLNLESLIKNTKNSSSKVSEKDDLSLEIEKKIIKELNKE